MDECSKELGISYATLFLDLQKFYDSVSLVLLMKASRSLQYPAIITLLAFVHVTACVSHNVAHQMLHEYLLVKPINCMPRP